MTSPAIGAGGSLSPSSSKAVALLSSSSSSLSESKNFMPKSQRPQKLPIPTPFREKLGTDNSPLTCKICLLLFNEPYTTVCGHTFCRACIMKSLQLNTQCPLCDSGLDSKRARICCGTANAQTPNGAAVFINNVMLCPNYTVAALLEQHKITKTLSPLDRMFLSRRGEHNTDTALAQQQMFVDDNTLIERSITNALFSAGSQLSLDSLKRIEEKLRQKRVDMELNDTRTRALLLYNFLEMMIEKRELTVNQVQAELELLRQDKQRMLGSLNDQLSASSVQRLVPDLFTISKSLSTQTENSSDHPSLKLHQIDEQGTSTNRGPALSPTSAAAICIGTQLNMVPERVSQLRHRMIRHVPSLETAYFLHRVPASALQKELEMVGTAASAADSLDDFSSVLKNMYRYGDMKVLTTLNYNIEAYSQPSIVSSIEFDKDGDHFVVAGVTRMIKLYDFNALMEHCGTAVDEDVVASAFLHQPLVQLRCNSKISNVSWNPYNKQMLANSDYDGTVQLWDTAVAKCTRTFDEHEKRCWTVQFNNIDPHLMASGSDDGKVKLWSVMCPQSLCAIDAKVNVCCVYFSPKSRDQLVFGSSDHCVHLYDLRQMSKPMNIFRGHRKAVSYVKYANENEVVSASTDSNLRLWDVNTGKCLQTMRGHQNEKNFVGLATDGTHVICGSENNQLYMYYKGIGEPLLSFDFGQRCVVNAPIAAQQLTTCGGGAGAGGVLSSPMSSAASSPALSAVTTTHSSELLPTAAANIDLASNSSGSIMTNVQQHGLLGAAASPWNHSPTIELLHNSVAAAGGTSSTSTAAQNGGGANCGDFVSAVCWKRNSNIVLAANSQGQTFVLRLE